MTRLAPAALALLLLGACSADPPAPADNATAQPVGSVGGAAPAPLPSVLPGAPEEPRPHAAPALQPLVAADLADRQLLGAGCSFVGKAGGPVLLRLRDEGDGLVKHGDRLRRISAATPGRAAIMAGGIAAGDHMSFTIDRATGDGSAWPATLTMRTDDGGETIHRGGRWECDG